MVKNSIVEKSGKGSGDRVPSPAEQRLCRPYLEQEIALVDPRLIIPVGRLAIGLFYPAGQLPEQGGVLLEEIIGTQKQVDGRWIIPLPHPSGASRWHQVEANRARLQLAVALIGACIKDMGSIEPRF